MCVLNLHEQGVELKSEAMLMLLPFTHHRQGKSVNRDFHEIKSRVKTDLSICPSLYTSLFGMKLLHVG